jgi:RNA polymerase sigma factor (sigma-70 family)
MDDCILPLIQGCLANDNASWKTLLQACTASAKNCHRKYSSLSPEDSDHIISNIYTKLFNGGLSNFAGVTKYELNSYFQSIAQNETISFFRQNLRNNRNVSIDQDCGGNDDLNETTLHDQLQDNSFRPDTIAEINDMYRKAMGQLSIRDKQILMFKVEGYKDREIAEMLSIPMNTVASSYSRMKEMLQRTMLMAILIILSGRNWLWATS